MVVPPLSSGRIAPLTGAAAPIKPSWSSSVYGPLCLVCLIASGCLYLLLPKDSLFLPLLRSVLLLAWTICQFGALYVARSRREILLAGANALFLVLTLSATPWPAVGAAWVRVWALLAGA